MPSVPAKEAKTAWSTEQIPGQPSYTVRAHLKKHQYIKKKKSEKLTLYIQFRARV